MTINSICVCGAGTMGAGIALVAAQCGFHTVVFDVNKQVQDNAQLNIQRDLQKLADKGKISLAEKDNTFNRIQFTSDTNECIADIIIEAIVERPEVKIGLFNQLAELNHSETIFATNTSSLSVTQIASGVMQPGRVIGMHFFNPAPVMKLVEIIKAEQTLDTIVRDVYDLAKQLNKTPVLCKDAPGFIVNRVARPYYIESLRIAEQGETNIETIDALLQSSGFKMGPFKLMDLIGNDINYAVSCSVYEQMGKPERLKPSYLQEEKVKAGSLGKKTGAGYYDYKEPAN